ncbi:MAG: sulfatase-like hydrolase/transferase [Vicinamibacterales bacterium]
MNPAPEARDSRLRRMVLVLARFLNASYFLLTASYCILTYSSFAYQQFIRPRLVSSLTTFIIWHPLWHWFALAVTVATLLPVLRRGPGRWWARTYVGALAALGVLLVARPILPSVENDGPGLWLAALFLLPPIWLATCDHIVTSREFAVERTADSRVVTSGVFAAVGVWVFHLASVPFRLQRLGDLPLGSEAFLFGALASLLVHVAVFGGLVIALLAVLRASRSALAEYWAIVALATLGTWLVVTNLVFASLSFRGPVAQLLAAELAVTLAAVWSGAARYARPSEGGDRSALGVWWSPFGLSSRRVAMLWCVVLPLVSFAAIQQASTFDWNFLVQNLLVLAAWLVASAALYTLVTTPSVRIRLAPTALAAGVLLTAGVARGPASAAIDQGLTGPSFVPEFALDAYAAVEPSYRLIRQLMWVEPSESHGFYATLRANSLIQHVDVRPVDVDFVPAPMPVASVTAPDIYLFVIDSLRRDYVAPYNSAVTFTPAFSRFAADIDTFAFQKHFARYGGTGLSMAAMWSGGMLLHKEYVLPFAPMDALGKLLSANGYHAIASPDHITQELIAPTVDFEPLDRGREEMDYDFCASVSELQQKVASRQSSGPVFGHTRSLNLHVSKMAASRSGAPGSRGFVGAAAAAVQRMDACFGTFIDFLKQSGRYGHSIVILTSDHGDSLGEAMRWGHSYTLYPEIVRTPLLMHVPAPWHRDLAPATGHATFSTDLTPTLYQLLGYRMQPMSWMYGRSLFGPAGVDYAPHRDERVLVASSYGPVYGIVDDDGRAMYVADGVNSRDYAYDMSALAPVRIGITAERRAGSRALIAQRLNELAAAYHFTPAQ